MKSIIEITKVVILPACAAFFEIVKVIAESIISVFHAVVCLLLLVRLLFAVVEFVVIVLGSGWSSVFVYWS